MSESQQDKGEELQLVLVTEDPERTISPEMDDGGATQNQKDTTAEVNDQLEPTETEPLQKTECKVCLSTKEKEKPATCCCLRVSILAYCIGAFHLTLNLTGLILCALYIFFMPFFVLVYGTQIPDTHDPVIQETVKSHHTVSWVYATYLKLVLYYLVYIIFSCVTTIMLLVGLCRKSICLVMCWLVSVVTLVTLGVYFTIVGHEQDMSWSFYIIPIFVMLCYLISITILTKRVVEFCRKKRRAKKFTKHKCTNVV